MKGETEVKADRLKLKRESIVLGMSTTYLAVREAIALSYYIRKVYEAVGFPIPPERLGMK